MAEAVMAGAVARGQGLGVSLAQIPWTRLELSLGHYDEARIHALAVFEKDPLYVGTMALADAVEVTVRSGDTNSARAALARLSERAEAGGAARGLDLLTRARALLAEDRDAEALYEESLDHLAPGSRLRSRGRGCSTGNGCDAGAAAVTLASSCGPRTRCSWPWTPRPGRIVPASSWEQPASMLARVGARPATC
jgi:hypothetical protein